jgi:hypothetical protein
MSGPEARSLRAGAQSHAFLPNGHLVWTSAASFPGGKFAGRHRSFLSTDWPLAVMLVSQMVCEGSITMGPMICSPLDIALLHHTYEHLTAFILFPQQFSLTAAEDPLVESC